MYDRAFFDRPIDRRGTACEKWDVAMARDARVSNPMWVADMDFRCPDEVVNALCERAAHPVYGYTEQTDRALAAMLDFMERRHGLKLTPSEQIMLPCVVSGLKAAVQAFTQPGDRIIVQPPVYGPFYASARDNGREVAECPLRHDDAGRYTMDLQSVEDACRAGARMMLLCSPHNPVGRVWSREELKALFAVLARYDVLLVSDEIHEDFVYRPGMFVPALDLAVEAGVRAISMTSASKTFNLAGLQQATAFCRDRALLDRLEKTLRDAGVVSGNNTPGKFENSGLTASRSEVVDAPVVNEFPLCLECKFIEYQSNEYGCGVIGKVVKVTADESVMRDGKLDMSLVNAIAFDPYTHGYYKVTDRVGEAFKDGLTLKK